MLRHRCKWWKCVDAVISMRKLLRWIFRKTLFLIFFSFRYNRVQPTSTLVANFVPNSTENITFTINNQLSNQVQRLVRDRPTTYDNLYQIYGSRNVGRPYGNARTEAFQHQLVSSILCNPSYQAMPSPTKHVVVGGSAMQPPLQVSFLFR